MTETIDEIGGDLKRVKDMGIEYIIFGYILQWITDRLLQKFAKKKT